MQNIYLELTEKFNSGALRAILTSGQAVVLHKLAVMSKDGDWIIKEDPSCLQHVLEILQSYGARYRLGAPLHLDWLGAGWSSHFEFFHQGMRVRTDFFARPPRISPRNLAALWQTQANAKIAFTDAKTLAEVKMTMREKDYPIIGELARKMDSPSDQLLFSRSAQDLIELAKENPLLISELSSRRPLLSLLGRSTVEKLEAALDKERREFMREDAARLEKYARASATWLAEWPRILGQICALPLLEAHQVVVREAHKLLPLVAT